MVPIVQIDCSLSVLCSRFSCIHVEIAEMLLAAKANVGAEDNDGDTPLMMAVLQGKMECVDVLVKACPLSPTSAMAM